MTAELNPEKNLSVQTPIFDALKNIYWPKSTHLSLFTIALVLTWAISNVHKSLKLLILMILIKDTDYFYPQLSQD